MAKKKKGKKARKKARQHFDKMPLAHLLQKGEALLAAAKSREAITVLKTACAKQPKHQTARLMLGRAYILREGQLRSKGLVRDADAIHHHALDYLAPDKTGLEEADLRLCLQSTSAENAVSFYRQFLAQHPAILEAEWTIAGHLLASEDWGAARQLPAKALLSAEVPVLEETARLMNEARWEEALANLRPFSRRSPLAPVKMLCRAMVCFYLHDDAGMHRALTMIPDGVFLPSLIQALKSTPQELPPLWKGGVISRKRLALLERKARMFNARETARLVKSIAGDIYPENPTPAILQLLSVLWPLSGTWEKNGRDFTKLFDALLPGPMADAMTAKYDFLMFDSPLECTELYFDQLDAEFPDPNERNLAASTILSQSIRWTIDRGLEPEMAYSLMNDDVGGLLGISSERVEEALLEMTIKAIELDPENRLAQELLETLPRFSNTSKQLVENGLRKIIDHQPDDPAPHLALAKLYFGKNAYRKAQNSVLQAEKLAPHDEKVREFHVHTLLQSIDANIKRKKFHLVKADLEKAERLSGKNTRANVITRRIAFDLEQTGQLSIFNGNVQNSRKDRVRVLINRHIRPLADIDRLKTLAFLQLERSRQPRMRNDNYSKCIASLLKSQSAVIAAFSSKSVRQLLLPEEGLRMEMEGSAVWIDFFSKRYPKIFRRLDDEDLPPVLEVLILARQTKRCRKEIQYRAKTSPEPFRTLYRFLSLVEDAIANPYDADVDNFEELISQIPQQQMEMFRTAARRLSKAADEPVRGALANFDFNLLDSPFGGPHFPDFPDFGEDPFDVAGDEDPVMELLEQIEMMIDEFGLRGAPEKRLKAKRREMTNHMETRMMFEMLSMILPPAVFGGLSPEARYLISGK